MYKYSNIVREIHTKTLQNFVQPQYMRINLYRQTLNRFIEGLTCGDHTSGFGSLSGWSRERRAQNRKKKNIFRVGIVL